MKKLFLSFSLVIAIIFDLSAQVSTVLFTKGTPWKYQKGTFNPASGWNQQIFSEANWATGNAPFWYGKANGVGTELTDMQTGYLTIYLRKTFQINVSDSMIGDLILNYIYDDGFRVYINGKKVLERNAGTSDLIEVPASGTVTEFATGIDTISADESNLKSGANTIAVVGFNVNHSSSDFYFDINATMLPPVPKASEVTFSHQGGYYTSNFNLTMSSETAGDNIYYTIDCSDPAISATAKTGKSPLTIAINPAGMTGRPNTPAVVVRAVVKKDGYQTRNSETRTYIYLNRVKTQTYPGTPWPSTSDNINGQVMEYDVDQTLASNFASQLDASFKSIPTVSIVTTNDNLFDLSSGIYVNALEHGELWEVPASLELTETNNSVGFANNVGLRIRGGWSRHNDFAKHAFRIFYRGDYGKKKLNYPLFGDDGTDEFEKFDIKCAQNYSWSQSQNAHMTYAQDEFCRDMQGQMGHPYTKSRYCHVFLNGMYWGLYELQERAESNFAASYMGGKAENYDVIKVDVGGTGSMEATDGDMATYQQLFNITKQGFVNNDNYFKVQGLNTSGDIDTSINALLDVDNMIDYMLNIFYSGNFDSPLSAYMGNSGANNYYALKNKKHKRQGFFFVVHDAEHTFSWNRDENSVGDVEVNRVSLEDLGMPTTLNIYNFTSHQMHYYLKSNAEYRLKFADHVYNQFYNNGLYAPSVVEANFRKRASQIDKAIIGESIRWGHGWLTRNDWVNAVNSTVSNFINLRTPIVIDQLTNAGLMGDLNPAILYVNSTLLSSSIVNLTGNATVQLNISGTSGASIYYTLDGSDPRKIGGSINPNAVSITSGSSIIVTNPLELKARVFKNNVWSPIREVLFTNTANRENIRITEIQYNPKDLNAASSKDMEFIEFKNIGDKGIDLGGCRLDSAINYTFPLGTIINPNGFIVIASDKNDFEYVYRREPTGVYSGNLSNRGERIVLFNENNQELINVKYDTTYPWPIQANGSGHSLVSVLSKPAKDEANEAYWKFSLKIYGSPFSDDSTYVGVDVKKTEALFCDVFPNPVTEKLYIQSNSKTNIRVQIYDLSGRPLANKLLNGSSEIVSIDFKQLGLKPGIYMVNVSSGNNKIQKKIIYQE